MAIWLGFTLLVAALVVLLPLRLNDLGYGVDAIAAVVGAAGIGGIATADLVGRAADRIGPVRLLRLGLLAMAACMVGLGLATALVPLLLLHAFIGATTSAVRVGAQMVVRNRVAETNRGRVHSAQGTIMRTATLVAPVTAGLLWDRLRPEWSFFLPALTALALLLAAGSLGVATRRSGGPSGPTTVTLTEMLRYSSGPLLFRGARAGRMLLIPLIGLQLDLEPSAIGLMVGVSAAADLVVSPVSGVVMDSRGRLAAIVPSFSLMAFGFALLALASGGWMLALAALVLGVGNGFSSGLLLTLGSDLAPNEGEGPFLGRFGALNDIGRLVGPFIVGAVGEAVGLGAAALALSVVTLAGLALVFIFIGETKPEASAAA